MNNTLEKENVEENLEDFKKKFTAEDNVDELDMIFYGKIKWDNENKKWIKLKI